MSTNIAENLTTDAPLVCGENSPELAELAKNIRAEQAQIVASCKAALRHAIAAGEYLRKAKDLAPHGDWLRWLEQNCEVPQRTAQAYIRLAKHGHLLLEEDPQRVADLSIRGAPHLLAKHKPPKVEIHEDPIKSVEDSLLMVRRFGKKVRLNVPDCLLFIGTISPNGAAAKTFLDGVMATAKRLGFGIRAGDEAMMVLRPPKEPVEAINLD